MAWGIWKFWGLHFSGSQAFDNKPINIQYRIIQEQGVQGHSVLDVQEEFSEQRKEKT